MNSFTSLFVFLFSVLALSGQNTMHDFTVTDTDGQVHRLYTDYLTGNQVVVIKFFFTSCPPCIANAPLWQQKYSQQGAGSQQVVFFNVTTITSDNNTNVAAFESLYSQTMPGISHDGGATSVTGPFKNGQYGTWYGTPSFAVIAPNRKLYYPVLFNQLDQTIAQAKTETVVIPSLISLQIQSAVSIPDSQVKWYLRDSNNPAVTYPINKNASGTYQFSYPSSSFPLLAMPEVVMESSGPAGSPDLKASDMLAITKHILGIEPFVDEKKKAAADVTGNGSISASDLLALRKVILGLETSFPNNTPSYRQFPGPASVPATSGSPVTVQTDVIKMGKVKY